MAPEAAAETAAPPATAVAVGTHTAIALCPRLLGIYMTPSSRCACSRNITMLAYAHGARISENERKRVRRRHDFPFG
ncbi:hypothetical protein GQ55_5G116500 [Panicum hallii var. hallii]|uniref:Uncharacterized protein n=1 Tax=Panicum hallii var. hallii TaxID=1504633 RepID=A0A2T7DFA2_9POAL|nr:hypothetical protein GQ55_5G116500 [Panicum hallii var. hallii]